MVNALQIDSIEQLANYLYEKLIFEILLLPEFADSSFEISILDEDLLDRVLRHLEEPVKPEGLAKVVAPIAEVLRPKLRTEESAGFR